KKSNLIYTVLLYLNNFAYGISGNMIGAVLVDLAFIYHTDIDTMSYIQAAAGAGYLVGSFGSFLYTKVNRQAVLIWGMFQWTVCITLMPHYGKLWLAFAATSAMTVATGAWDSSTSIWIVEIWSSGSPALLQGLQFFYGLGSIVAPLLCAPFVYGRHNVTEDGNKTITPEMRIHSLTIPFSINAAFQVLFPILFLIMFFAARYRKPETAVEEKEDKEVVLKNKDEATSDKVKVISFRKTKLALLGICVATYVACEFGYVAFSISMYQYLPIHLSAPLSARVQSIMCTTFTLGRLLTAFISLKLKPDLILAYHYVILLGSIAFLYLTQHNLNAIYAGNVVLGFGFSAIWPGLFGFTEHFLGLTARVCTLYAFCAGTACLVIPLLLGSTFKAHPIVLLEAIFVFTVVSFIIFSFVRIWILIDSRRERLTRKESLKTG
ncbi:hypothetical protein TYRP_005232, partial [Tyrophagus putrescentiae]